MVSEATAEPLFRPFRLGALALRNRVVMAPMTREFAPGGVPTAAMAAYYRRRAAGGVALILTEGTPPDAVGAFGAAVPRFHGADALAAWRPVVEAIHAEGARVMPQLWHVGAFEPSLIGMADSLAAPLRLSPSGLDGRGEPLGRAMTTPEIERTVAAFAAAAAAARRIGFDGVEIHGAHGYLPDQFLRRDTNRRTDAYGGGPEGRVRFVVELVRACKAAAGADFPLSLRLSQWKQLNYRARLADTPAELAALLEPLAEAGIDLFHASTRRFWEPEFAGSPLTFAGWVRKLSGRPVIAVGSVTLSNDSKSADGKVRSEPVPENIGRVAALMEAGEFDLIAVGRALLANPDWVELVRSGRADALRPFSREHLAALT